jgi:hypothetical protein
MSVIACKMSGSGLAEHLSRSQHEGGQEGNVDFVKGCARWGFILLLLLGLGTVGCGRLGFGPKAAKVVVKFDIYGGDNAFSAVIYAQEIVSGKTYLFPYDPHTPYITIDLKIPGRYVFYARLVEAPDDYHYGYTGTQPVAYGHMTRGGTQDPATASLIGVDVQPGGKYKVYINDYRAIIPEAGKPVKVPWRL